MVTPELEAAKADAQAQLSKFQALKDEVDQKLQRPIPVTLGVALPFGEQGLPGSTPPIPLDRAGVGFPRTAPQAPLVGGGVGSVPIPVTIVNSGVQGLASSPFALTLNQMIQSVQKGMTNAIQDIGVLPVRPLGPTIVVPSGPPVPPSHYV